MSILIIISSTLCFGQIKNIVEVDSISSELHQKNNGKIFFTNERISKKLF